MYPENSFVGVSGWRCDKNNKLSTFEVVPAPRRPVDGKTLLPQTIVHRDSICQGHNTGVLLRRRFAVFSLATCSKCRVCLEQSHIPIHHTFRTPSHACWAVPAARGRFYRWLPLRLLGITAMREHTCVYKVASELGRTPPSACSGSWRR